MAYRKISRDKRERMLADVFEARRDLSGLAEAHGLSPDDLAEWIGEEENRRCLAGLCLLADLQTQLMLSRYRQVAVSELIKQASGGGDAEGGVSVEQARKACVDLLKADLKRADLPTAGPAATTEVGTAGDHELASLREALFGHEEPPPVGDGPTSTDENKDVGETEGEGQE